MVIEVVKWNRRCWINIIEINIQTLTGHLSLIVSSSCIFSTYDQYPIYTAMSLYNITNLLICHMVTEGGLGRYLRRYNAMYIQDFTALICVLTPSQVRSSAGNVQKSALPHLFHSLSESFNYCKLDPGSVHHLYYNYMLQWVSACSLSSYCTYVIPYVQLLYTCTSASK